MDEKINVIFTSPALSILQFENGNSESDHEGFLVGSFSENVVKTVTDAEINKRTIEKTIYITNVMVVHTGFYDNIGKINVDSINNYRTSKDIIGWYRFRRNVELKPTLREKIIHKGLCEFFKIPSNLFTLGLFTSSVAKNRATHHFSHAFYRYNNTKFLKIPLQISNLADSSDTYKTTPGPQSSKLNSILLQGSRNPIGTNMVETVQQEIDKYMNKLITVVAELSKEEFELKKELGRLENRQHTEIPSVNKQTVTSAKGKRAKRK